MVSISRCLVRGTGVLTGVLVLSAAATWHAPVGAAQTAPDTAFAPAEAAIRAAMEKSGIPGAAVAVVVGDKVVWTKGFGVANAETGAPVTPDTLFQIGSVTKSFTAAAILAAAADGAIALDKPVSTYVSGLTPCVGAPTLAQLLSHTGGIIDEPDEFGPQGEEGLGAYQRTWTNEYCLLPPGRAFSYSNSGFSLAGLALQEVDAKPFADVMKARVLAPLGMTRTTFRPTEAMTWPLAVGHRKSKDGKFEVVRPLANDARLWPAGTLYSSANEMARLVTALLNDGRVEGKQALPAGIAAKMRTAAVQVPTTDQRYGQGMFLQAEGDGHGGTMTGYVAQYGLEVERRVAIVVITNADNANPKPIADLVRPAALAAAAVRDTITVDGGGTAPIVDVVYPAARETATVDAGATTSTTPALSPARAGGYVGTYRNPRRFTVEVVQQGDALVLKRFGRDFPMKYVAPGRFSVDLPRGGTETIAFGLGPEGRADYLQMNVWALARVAAK